MDTTDQPNSICHVQPIQMYQLPPHETSLNLSFKLLYGEAIYHHGSTVDGLIVLTNYRLYLQNRENHYHLPLGLIENVEHRDMFYLHVGCKDARTYRCIFTNNETCLEWFEWITKAVEPTRQIDQIFAFYHFIWSKDAGGEDVDEKINNLKSYTFDHGLFKDEMERQQFEGDSWRISEANKNYKLCPTYPPYLIVPSCINDETLEAVAKFRSSRRIPAVVWRHTKNGAVIARCSQPEVGWLGWRSSEDEDLIKAISQACSFDQRNDKESILSHSPGSHYSEDGVQITNETISKEKKVLIMDARSYTTAVANRARGGGCECPEYYPNCEIQFMNLANIHSIRKSFNALRLLCMGSADQPNWFSQLENTRWLQHMSGLMKAAVTLVNAVEREARPVLVHCSDGWDRTPQIVALAELLLDPFYRTIDGFRILIEREWLAFGHKFADRCGHSASDDANERCPVFLQWLDCIHQLVLQFDCAFEFSQSYLVKLAQHVYSNLYGTFLCNTFQERMRIVNGKTFSVWEFLNSSRFRNHLYAGPSSSCGIKVLWPQCNIRDLQLWHEMYLGSWESNFNSGSCPGPPLETTLAATPSSSPSHMTKTRSYGDLINVAATSDVTALPIVQQMRRSSDPNINLIVTTNGPADFLCNQRDCIFNGGDDRDFMLSKTLSNGDVIKCNGVDCVDNEVIPSNCNNNLNGSDDADSDNEVTENTVCDRLETSTDTLVSDSHNISSSPLEVNGFEKLRLCAQNLAIVNNNHHQHHRKYNSISPMYSRASSCSGWETGLSSQHLSHHHNKTWQQMHAYNLGDDGLVPVSSLAQERLSQIVQENRRKEELLERELHTYRQALLRQSCHRCNNNDSEKIDDSGSVVESICSAGEGQASAVESLRSDLSWEALEENSILTETATRWVPDHAVSRCTGCQTEFWVGKRKHHCRNCGKIFCASCSQNSTPLPSEQLYMPVRVCTGCFSQIQRDCVDLPEQCKHSSTCNGQPTNNNPQITASSN